VAATTDLTTKTLAPFKGILIHEWFMGLLQVQIMLRLLISTKEYGWIAAYCLVLAIFVGLIRQGGQSLSPGVNRMRLLWNIVVMNFVFTSIRYVVPALGCTIRDSLLVSIDKILVGGDLSIWAQRFYSKPLTEVMSLGYMLFIVFLFFSFLYYGFRAQLGTLRAFCGGLFTLYAFGMTGYTLVPAQGPWVYLADRFTVPVEGYLLTGLNEAMVKAGSAGYDVFPSLHVGVGLYLLLFFRSFDRLIWRIYLVPFVFLVLSTIYLRYHYFIDLVCGAILSLLCFSFCPDLATARQHPHSMTKNQDMGMDGQQRSHVGSKNRDRNIF